MLTLLADENMPLVDEFFADFAWIKRKPGRDICRDDVESVDILLVRSVTKVDKSLLEGTPVKFVGTATIGTDHIDLDYLKASGRQFAYAPGSNARAVAEYVLCAIAYWAEKTQADLSAVEVGIIGAGNVGSQVALLLGRLGIAYKLNDPILEAEQAENNNGKRAYCSIEAIQQCQVVTCHVPLTFGGEHPTYHMIGSKFLEELGTHSLLINSSRGAVVDSKAALTALNQGSNLHCVFDVWEGEPEINLDLMNKALLGTPHIAGYSLEGKIRGTYMLYERLRHWLEKDAVLNLSDYLPKTKVWEIPKNLNSLSQNVKDYYDIEADSEQFKKTLLQAGEDSAKNFDRLRKHYKNRLEFSRMIGQ